MFLKMSLLQTTLPIDEYLKSQFHPSSPKYQQIPEVVQELSEYKTISQVKGDGNCLTYAILVYVYQNFDKSTFINILTLVSEDFPNLDNFESPDLFFNQNLDYFIGISKKIRALIEEKWFFKGEACYHMDDTAINGLAINMIMKILGIKKISIFHAFDELYNYVPTWRTIEQDDHFGVVLINEINLFTTNGCHYGSLNQVQ